MSEDVLESFQRGNPFDKLLRSYDEYTADGLPLYRNNRASKHYKYSVAAYGSGLKASELYGEHRIPLKVIRKRLLASQLSLDCVRDIMQSNEVVLITKVEQLKLDRKLPPGLGLRSSLPACGTDRLIFAGIEIASETLDNHL